MVDLSDSQGADQPRVEHITELGASFGDCNQSTCAPESLTALPQRAISDCRNR